LHEKIGEGGMGVVYLASDLENRPVAVKVLGPAVAGDPNARRRLAREVETMRLVRSRNVAEILDADVDGPAPYIVTRYVPGRTLDAVVRDDGPLYGTSLDRLATGLANAIAAIHAAGVVHRDLKPGNVMLDGDEPVVIDFGIAHIPDATRLTQTGMVMGTPGYLAPEVIEGQPSSGASDVHSWGTTVAFAATGRQPYGVGTYQTIFFRVLHGKADLTGVPARWLPSVVAALDVNPARRPPVWQLAAGPTASMPFQQPNQYPQPARTAVAYPYRGPAEVAADVRDLLPPVDYSRPRSLVAAAPAGLAAGPVARSAGPVAPPAPAVPDDLPDAGFGLVSLGMGVGAVALALLLPVAGTAIVLALLTLLRAADRAQNALAERRSLRGARPSDIVIVIVSAPWTVVRSVIVTLLLAPLALLVAGAAAGAAVAFGRAQTLPEAGSWAAGAAIAWYCVGPGSRGPRRQLRRISGSVIKTRAAMLAALISTWCLGAAAVSAMLSQPPLIWPATTWMMPPHLMPTLGLPSLGSTLHSLQAWLLKHSAGLLHLP
jgi:hypothetical protein